MQNRMRNKAKAHSKNSIKQKLNNIQAQKAAQKTAVKSEPAQKITAENAQAEAEWNKELAAFKAIQQKKVDQKKKNENLLKT